MVRILALDTSTAACSVALWRDGVIVARRFELMERGHAEQLMPMVETVMADAGEDPLGLDLVATTVGPGAFTGLRLGLAAARALALAAGVGTLGLRTTEALAAALPGGEGGAPIIAVIDSKRGDVYAEVFSAAAEPLAGPQAIPPADLPALLRKAGIAPGRCRLCGDAQEAARGVLDADGWTVETTDMLRPDAAEVAALAAARWRPGETPPRPAPLYLRPPDAVKPKNGGRLRR